MQQLKQLTNAIGLAGELLDTQQLVGGSCGIVLAVTKSAQGSANAEPTGSQPKSPWQKK